MLYPRFLEGLRLEVQGSALRRREHELDRVDPAKILDLCFLSFSDESAGDAVHDLVDGVLLSLVDVELLFEEP